MTNQVIANAENSKTISYDRLLDEVQAAVAKELWELSKEDRSSEKEEKILQFISKQIEKRHVVDVSNIELVNRLYNDIEEYSVLTEYLDDDSVEGIDVNAWDNIRVTYADGRKIQIPHFISPEHAITITKRLLQSSGVTIDDAIPMAETSIGSSIRITALITPIVPKETGVVIYIRKLREGNFTADEYIKNDFATETILKSLSTALLRGVSIIVVGQVNTGKTTLVKHLLGSLPADKKIITIESGAREMNLVKYDADGNPVNNVIHMLTREHENERQNITQEKLVVKDLRLNPDITSVAEMRDTEAYAAVEASNSGHIVISTVHAGSAQYAYKRIANLSRKRYSTDFHTALAEAVEAYPLSVFIHTTDDNVRRIMSVCEAHTVDDVIKYNTLWRYEVDENVKDSNGGVTVMGHYEKVNNPSEQLLDIMKRYGISKDELAVFYEEA